MEDPVLNKAMKASVIEGALATVMGTLVSGVFLTGFALEIGASRLQIGILAGLPVLGHLAQLAGAYFIERTGDCKKICVNVSIFARLLLIPMIIFPLIINSRDGSIVWYVIASYAFYNFLGSFGGVAWLLWIKNLIPQHHQVPLMGRRHIFNTGLSLIIGLTGSFFLDWSRSGDTHSIAGFFPIFAVAMACGLSGLPFLNSMPAPSPMTRHQGRFGKLFTQPLKDRNFRGLVFFYAFWNLAVQIAQPFYMVYMLQKLGLSFVAVTALTTMASLLGVITSPLWVRLSVQFGVKPIVFIATLGDALFALMWIFVSPEWCWLLIPVHCTGILSAPLAMGPNNMLLRLAPEKNAAPYFAVFNSIVGTTAACAAILGGLISTTLIDFSSHIGPFEIGGLKMVFLLSVACRLISLPLLLRLSDPSSQPVSQVLSILRTRSTQVKARTATTQVPQDQAA